MNIKHDIGVASHIGTYNDAVSVPPGARWLISAGTPGLARDGSVPEGIAAQAELAWQNILKILDDAGMNMSDVVKVTHYLLRTEDIPEYVRIRSRYMREAKPASMLLITPAFVRPEFLVEIEIIAARA